MDTRPLDTIHLIEHWPSVAPDAEAVRFGEQHWTWAEWADRIRRNAAGQLAAGLRPGDRVAFLDKNHPACLETTLAAGLVGTANAVVNFRLAAPEIGYIINDARARIVFVGPEFVPVLHALADELPTVERIIVVGGEQDEYEAFLAARQPFAGEPVATDDGFLQLYTSGTTGFPKGAVLTNASLTAHAVAIGSVNDVNRDSVGMVPMPLFHVGGSAWGLLSLYHGARTVVVRDINPAALLDELVREGVTHTFLVPAVFGFLLQVPDVAERDYSRLKALVYGASPMPLPLLRASLKVFPGDFYQVYGMTEASGAITALGPAEHRDPAREHLLTSAGLPAPGVELAIVDPVTGERLPAGEVGEVMVRTRQLMAGYWQRPEATTAALTEDGWLHSGDAGYLDAEGYLFLADRIKDLIISGGENIYPAEIERVLVEHPSVAEVAVIGVPDERWGEVGHAMVVPAAGVDFDESAVSALLAYCRERLAGFKVPAGVTVVSELPRNATGKVLKRQLREPFWAGQPKSS